MKKTRRECEMETGYTPEDISKLARDSPAIFRLFRESECWNKVGGDPYVEPTHEQKVEWVYEGLKYQHQKMLNKIPKNQTQLEEFKKASDLTHNCTGSTACFGCERERRNAYASGGNYY